MAVVVARRPQPLSAGRSVTQGALHHHRPQNLALLPARGAGRALSGRFPTTTGRRSTDCSQGTMDSGDEFFFHNFICSSDDSSSDDEELAAALVVHEHITRKRPRYRGPIPGHAPALDRNREKGHVLLYADYFKDGPLFGPHQFRRRFRMRWHVFNRIREGLIAHDPYFECKVDALGKLGFSSYQKCTAAIRMLAYGIPGDLVDEYICSYE